MRYVCLKWCNAFSNTYLDIIWKVACLSLYVNHLVKLVSSILVLFYHFYLSVSSFYTNMSDKVFLGHLWLCSQLLRIMYMSIILSRIDWIYGQRILESKKSQKSEKIVSCKITTFFSVFLLYNPNKFFQIYEGEIDLLAHPASLEKLKTG